MKLNWAARVRELRLTLWREGQAGARRWLNEAQRLDAPVGHLVFDEEARGYFRARHPKSSRRIGEQRVHRLTGDGELQLTLIGDIDRQRRRLGDERSRELPGFTRREHDLARRIRRVGLTVEAPDALEVEAAHLTVGT